MKELPKYIIEHVLGKWELYNTQTCIALTFETKSECEDKLKELNTKTN